MNVLLSIAGALWFLTWLTYGFNFFTIMAFVSTCLFCGRKVKYFCRPSTLIIMESIALFVTTATQLLFNRFNIINFLIVLCLRIIFIGIVFYDTKLFVYVTIEKRKEEEE